MRKASIALTLALIMAHPLLGQPTSLLVGTWKLNLAESTFRPGPPPKTHTVTWEVAKDGLTFTTNTVNAQGQTVRGQNIEKSDGTPGPILGTPTPNSTRGLKRIDDHHYEDFDAVDGRSTITRTLVIAPNGKTLTVTSSGINAQGQAVNSVQVFQKQ